MALALAKDLPLLCPPLSWTDSLQSGGWDILHFTRAPVQAVGVPPAGAQCLKGRALVPGSSAGLCSYLGTKEKLQPWIGCLGIWGLTIEGECDP